ncbi:MAG: hypothetical protein SCARUB_05170 [Candidatus Scalindua rubra]|uniref:PsbP C-terminal domain-containing protein n=1 Tax=Candidatus Scalindua rubra TaxID=1872076 RepID=A0A1E3X298_9BACT|nr:MAG: hypothetical protein SCARUB_05170 [Candidatus Scalindua rubra]
MNNRHRITNLFVSVIFIVECLGCGNPQEVLQPNEYHSQNNQFLFRYGKHWDLKTNVPEPGLEVMLICADSLCGFGTNITFGILYDEVTTTLSQKKVLSIANSRQITTNILNNPLVTSVIVKNEGKTRLGNQPAYQVVMTVKYINGNERVRHSFITFSVGYWYNVSINADPYNYTVAMTTAQSVLDSFRLQQVLNE